MLVVHCGFHLQAALRWFIQTLEFKFSRSGKSRNQASVMKSRGKANGPCDGFLDALNDYQTVRNIGHIRYLVEFVKTFVFVATGTLDAK